jgi:formylglycine-generating enzyme required for sulfatase activity
LHTSWGQLPEDRADLYEETVKLLLSRWQRAQEVKGPEGETVLEPGIVQVLAADEAHVRAALHALAFRAHERQGEGEERKARPADIGEDEVLLALMPLFKEGVDPDLVLRYLETRAGLLVGRAPGVYAFPHRSFQEYLTACHLADGPDFASRLRERVWADIDWWRQVFLLGVGKAKQGGLGNAVHVINTLVPAGPEEVDECGERHWQAAALAAHALTDLRFPGEAEGEPSFEALLKRVRRWLVALLEAPDVLASRERAEAGDVLGRLGDPRPGVGIIPPVGRETPGEGTLPDILWVHVPAGPFLMGSPEDEADASDHERPEHTLGLPAFYITRYPVTNAQYRPFVAGGGYDKPRYWTEEGWGWRTGERKPDLSAIDDEDARKQWADWLAGRPVEKRDRPFWWDHSRWGLPNRPVVGVTWYEALAYCRWLTERLQVSGDRFQVWRNARLETLNLEPETLQVRLPSEAEWEKAARGADGRRWPWGNEGAEGRANTEEAGVEETSAVGCFPAGASPWGALDMAGNVWEWTCSRWGRTSIYRPDYGYPYDADDGREALGGPDLRVLRGGSWNNVQRLARCAARYRSAPDIFSSYFGFRLVVSLVHAEC